MKKSIADLKGIWKGEDVYVVGSGSSVDRFRGLGFLEGKKVIAMNDVWKWVRADFMICTHADTFTRARGQGLKCVVSALDLHEGGGTPNDVETPEDYFVFGTGKVFDFEKNLEDLGSDDRLCLGNTISVAAVNLAAHLGAKTIFLIGVDCAAIEGKVNFGEYFNRAEIPQMQASGSIEAWRLHMNDAFVRNVRELSAVRARVKEVYGADVVSITPFIGLKCEGVSVKDQLSAAEVSRLG
jgi:hypothetical protein